MARQVAGPVVAVVAGMDEYQRRVIGAARDVLRERGVPLVAHSDGPHVRGAQSGLLVSILRRTPVFGVLTMNASDAEAQAELIAMLADVDAPTVHIGAEIEGLVSVRGDNETGMRELMRHLLSVRSPERVALVRGVPHQADSMARERIFREELVRSGRTVDDELMVTGMFAPEATYLGMEQLLRRRQDFDAVVALNDRSALAVVDALTDAGLRVPEDVAVTGFDNELVATYWPGLTTVDQALEEQGATAAHLLIAQHDAPMEPGSTIVASRVVIRGSTAPKGHAPVAELETAVAMARVEKGRLAAQDGILAMSHALDYCWTVDDVVEVLDTHLARLGVVRGFLALYERYPPGLHGAGMTVTVSTERAELMLDHRDGHGHPIREPSFDAHELLPRSLADELEHGLFVLQPLAVLDRPFGFILFEQRAGSAKLTELMRIDLSRALDGVLTTEETRTHAAMLERVVARRTQELQTEVMTRRRAERELQRANQELHRSAMLDGLTQIANRTAFSQHLDRHWTEQATDGAQLALLMVDVDAFKPYNDHYGHVLGDEALRTVASCLRRATWGSNDLACRYGGEEFAVVLPRSGSDGAVAVAQRFQQLLADAAIEHETSPVAAVLTASIGIAVTIPTRGIDPETLVEAADQAMYRAKALGRNRIQLASSISPDADRGRRAGRRGDPAAPIGSPRATR